MEQLENRLLMSAAIEPIDGVGNNIANPTWGSTGADLIRLAPAAYADGIDAPSLPGDLSAREISNILNNQADPSDPSQDLTTVDLNSLSDFGYAFGQFMDHDLDNTPDGGASLPIEVAPGDPIGPDALPFTRSITDPATGTSTSNPAQQVTEVTSYFDLSQIYGSTQDVADALRTFQGGLLKTSPGNMLPYDNSTYFTPAQIAALNMANDSQALPESELFAAGDVRANENIELTALETLFVRNHNLIAGQLQQQHPGWTDEQIYQEARKINIAEYQDIIYNEWIPAVLGSTALSAYTGYNPNVNATISNEFSTVAYRFGHSLVSGDIARDNNSGQSAADPISLAFDFFDPNLLNPNGVVDPLTGLVSTDIGAILKGEADGNGQAMDTMAIGDIRNLLFGNGIPGGQDLIALDVQRGRDHGIPDYNTLRVALGLPAVTSFSQITSNVQVQEELEAAYPGGVDTIDAFEGGLAEDHVKGSDVGPLFQAIMVDQFTRLRDGDRFFYLNETWNRSELNIFQQGNTLAKIIEANTNITNLQSDVFYFKASISGAVFAAGSRPGCQTNGVSGITVELEDTDGDILATTSTDSHGKYSFNQLSGYSGKTEVAVGLAVTGKYKIVLVLPSGMTQTSPSPKSIEITRGDTNATGVNFSVAYSKTSGSGNQTGCNPGQNGKHDGRDCHGQEIIGCHTDSKGENSHGNPNRSGSWGENFRKLLASISCRHNAALWLLSAKRDAQRRGYFRR
jgi:peroxidase